MSPRIGRTWLKLCAAWATIAALMATVAAIEAAELDHWFTFAFTTATAVGCAAGVVFSLKTLRLVR